jgi:plasmid stabilization system protein ParE
MRKLLIRPQARLDLLEIWHHLAEHSVPRANAIAERLELGIRDLLSMPGKGHRRNDVSDPRYRFWAVHPWIVVYRYDHETLTVVRVVHGARNLRQLFRRA